MSNMNDLIKRCEMHSDRVKAALAVIPSAIALDLTGEQLHLLIASIDAGNKRIYDQGYTQGYEAGCKAKQARSKGALT